MVLNDALTVSIEQPIVDYEAANDWNQLDAITTIALDNENHNSELVALQERSVYQSKMRAVPWEHNETFTEEQNGNAAMIQYVPHDPTSSLRIGTRYADQGFQTKAIEVFDRGLCNVSKDDDYYKDLYDTKQRALAKHNRRIDIIAIAPLEIMCSIVDKLSQKALFECVMVSPIWRQYLLTYPDCWAKVCLNRSEEPLVNSICRTLPLVGHYVQELSLAHSPELARCLELVKTKSFCNLHFLQIQDPVYFSCPMDYSFFTPCLQYIAQSLLSLELHFLGEVVPALSKILAACRNLTGIRFCAPSSPAAFGELALSFTTSLRDVALEVPNASRITDNLIPLFQCSPHIQNLVVHGCNADIYRAIHDHCPNIRLFKPESLYPLSEFKHIYSSNESNGMTVLHVDEPSSSDAIAPLLDKHRLSLQFLDITLRYFDSWGNIAFHLPNLTRLTLCQVPSTVASQLSFLLDTCRKLERLHLYQIHAMPPQVLEVASKLRQLSCLLMHKVDFSEQSMLGFLRRIQNQQDEKRPGLAALTIYSEKEISGAVLVASANISTLNRLSIVSFSKMSVKDERDFAIGLGRLPNLQDLCLADMTLSKESLLPIAESKTLLAVGLYDIQHLTEDQVRDAFSSNANVRLAFKEYENEGCQL